MEQLKTGLSFICEVVVGSSNTALTMGSGDMAVFATPAMIALMENAAASAVKVVLEEGMTTVGTQLNVSHLKATPVGSVVRAEAILTEVDGRRLVFRVSAADSSGQPIGEGTHERFVVNREKFLSKL